MRRLAALFVFGLLVVLTLTGCAGSGPGASPGAGGSGKALPWLGGSIKIGYVRSDVISQRLADYRDADNTLRSENAQWTAEAERMEAEVRGKEAKAEELRLILSPDRRKQLEDEVTQARRELQRYRESTWYAEESRYIKRRKELMQPIDARVNDAIWKVAEAEGFDIVLDTVAGNVVYAKPGLDITDKVIEELQR